MIKLDEIRNFVSGNFTGAVLSGKLVDDNIVLELKLNGVIGNSNNFIHVYNVDLEELVKEPVELFNYLFSKYLENNSVIGVSYFVNLQNHSDKTSCVINGIDNSFIIALRQDVMNLLSSEHIKRIEQAKYKGILKVLNDVDINKIVLHNFDSCDIGRDYRTGLRCDTLEDGVYHYHALRINDSTGKPINTEEEKNFTFKMLELLCQKGNVNYEELNDYLDVFKVGYYNRMFDYKINDKISLNGYTNADLFMFVKFLKKYLSDYNDEVKNNQMKLILNRKEW